MPVDSAAHSATLVWLPVTIRGSERDSVILGWNLAQANLLIS